VARRVVIVGCGITGLTLAYELTTTERDLDVLCLEASTRAGGNIGTLAEEGFVCEWGPNGFLDNAPATLDLVRRLGLSSRLLRSNAAAATRFLFHRGALRKLGARAFLTSGLVSLKGRARLLTEPFRRRAPDGEDESIEAFAARRIGPEAAAVLVDAMVSGIYAGDIRKLSLRATFPKLWQLERDHGSLVRGMLAQKRQARAGGPTGPGGRLTSFAAGLGELIDALASALAERGRLGAGVSRVTRSGGASFRLDLTDGTQILADSVVLACPAWSAAPMLRELDTTLAATLAEILSAPVVVVHLGFDERALGGRPNGFGYLVPSGEGLQTLGTLWTSSIFPNRAPQGKVLLTSMIGGARHPEAVELADDRAQATALCDLRTTMGITSEPGFVRVFKHERGIPQYTLGHPQRLATIEARLSALPGLYLAGNSYRGISMNACIEEARTLAPRILESLSARRR